VVGEKDMAAGVVSVRTREGKQLPAMPVDDFAQLLAAEARVPDLTKPDLDKKT
jgi:threonyl-tRNA synthetase